MIIEQRFPFIEWRKPLPVAFPDTSLFTCRFCVAFHGLNRESDHLWITPQQVIDHIEKEHP